MNILIINEVCGITSTGKICAHIAGQFEKEGHNVKIAFGRDFYVPEAFRRYAVPIGSKLDVYCHMIRARLLDRSGFGSARATKSFLKWAESFNPDFIWLHNLHGYYLNIDLLFSWLKKHPSARVFWTLHDCWAFTGHCAYFSYQQCSKWKTGCEACPQKKEYPKSWCLDQSRRNYADKKAIFTGVRNLTLITPSQWLADLTRSSFLSEYPVRVLHNTLDTSIFKPTASSLRQQLSATDSTVLMGIANVWEKRKGLDAFLMLAAVLPSTYTLVLVGLTDQQIHSIAQRFSQSPITFSNPTVCTVQERDLSFVQQFQETLPTDDGILFCNEKGVAFKQDIRYIYRYLHVKESNEPGGARLVLYQKTNNMQELVNLYSMSDYLINPTLEDNYPTVNLEAAACGTQVLTFDTGGSRETLMHSEDKGVDLCQFICS